MTRAEARLFAMCMAMGLAITVGVMTLVMHLERPQAAVRQSSCVAVETDNRVFSGHSPQDPQPPESFSVVPNRPVF